MATEAVIKQNSNVRVTVSNKTKLYTIRLLSNIGATFSIDINGSIKVGQSSNMTYSYDTWCLLQKEIEEGRRYMARVKLTGGFGKIESVKTIKPSALKPNCVYRDIKGRYIFYLGTGYFTGSLQCCNRIGAKECWGIFESLDDISDIYLPNNINNCELYLGSCKIKFEHYTTKPSKIVELVKEYPLEINTYITSNRGIFGLGRM